MKVLLINPLDREFMPPSMPPLGLAYIAAALENAEHGVTVIDLNVNRDDGLALLTEALNKEKFDLVGISSIITQYKKVKELGKLIKKITPNIPLVMGGAGPTSIPELYLKECHADLVCVGEGEETIKELILLLGSNKSLEHCPGIVFFPADKKMFKTNIRPPISNIDQIPFPAWNKFDLDIYTKNHLFRNNRNRAMSIMSTRGCPGRCNYCMCNFGRKLRVRSDENIIAEIVSLEKNYKIEHVHFIDDTFITSPARVNGLCKRLKKEFPFLTWSANVRADMVRPELLREMKRTGCVSLAYGIESGSPSILKYIRKGITVEQASNAIKWTREAGIALTAYFMIGMPPETPETIKESVEFCKQNLVGGEFFFATPIPGTDLYQYAKERIIISNDDLYLEYVGEVRDFLVNLTAMSNEDLFRLKDDAEAEIKDHLSKHNISVRKSIKKSPWEIVNSLPKF